MSSELEFPGVVKRGSRGPAVTRAQEWLCLHGLWVNVDADFGPATELAVRQFQAAQGLQVDGVVGPMTWDRLTAPLRAALVPIEAGQRTLGELTAAWAYQQLASRPRELPGNRGPWVRTYMKGDEGPAAKWCAGFACFCLEKAAAALGVSLPIKPSFSCDELALRARKAGCLLEEPGPGDRARILPGSFFLTRKTRTDWVHTGIVVEAGPEAFRTIEGNTNDSGSANGDGVYQRARRYGGYDFILLR